MGTNRNWKTKVITAAAIFACMVSAVSGICAELSVNEQRTQAAKTDSLEQVKAMPEKGGTANADYKYGQTALSRGSAAKKPDVVQPLGARAAKSSVSEMPGEERTEVAGEESGLLKEFHLSSASVYMRKENFDRLADEMINLIFVPRKPVHIAETRWYDPNDVEFRTIRRVYDRPEETGDRIERPREGWYRVHSIPTGELYDHKPGMWKVVLYIDNQLAGRQSFFVGTSSVEAPPAPSFDCKKATFRVEKIIRGDEELSKLAKSMTKAYRKAVARNIRQEMIRSQKQWLRYVGNTCRNADCIKKAYETRIKELGLSSYGVVIMTPSPRSLSLSRIPPKSSEAPAKKPPDELAKTTSGEQHTPTAKRQNSPKQNSRSTINSCKQPRTGLWSKSKPYWITVVK